MKLSKYLCIKCVVKVRENNQLKSVEIIRISRLDFALISSNPLSGLSNMNFTDFIIVRIIFYQQPRCDLTFQHFIKLFAKFYMKLFGSFNL